MVKAEAIFTASHSAIFTATVAVKIVHSLYLRRRTNSKEGAQSAIEIIQILISKHKIVKLKLTLTLFLTLPDTGGTVLTLMLGYRSYIRTLYQNTTKEFT